MELKQLEYAAEIVFRMCREHPEVCPHDYEWIGSTVDHDSGTIENRYRCKLCNHVYTKLSYGVDDRGNLP